MIDRRPLLCMDVYTFIIRSFATPTENAVRETLRGIYLRRTNRCLTGGKYRVCTRVVMIISLAQKRPPPATNLFHDEETFYFGHERRDPGVGCVWPCVPIAATLENA